MSTRGKIGLRIFLVFVLAVALFFGIQAISGRNKILKNVSVGVVDVGGMTQDEAQKAIASHYEPILANASVTIYASEEAKQKVLNGEDYSEYMSGDMSIEDAQGVTLKWVCDPSTLKATVPSASLAAEAYKVGRENGGIVERFLTSLFGNQMPVFCDFNQTAFEELASDIDATIGDPRIESSVYFEDSVAYASEGHDGNIIERDKLEDLINEGFLSGNEEASSFVAWTNFAPMRITYEEATRTADRINTSIASGATMSFLSNSWDIYTETLASWTTTEIREDGDSYYLAALIKKSQAQISTMKNSLKSVGRDPITVSFQNNGGEITVLPSSTETMPSVVAAVSSLQAGLYGEDGHGSYAGLTPLKVTVEETVVPSVLSFDDALNIGMVGEISSYTTEYTTGTEARANRNFNIHRCADLLNNSICKANGGTWDFNETTGDCNEAAGFKKAGAIIDGLHIDSIGGGICQVATTVFNAVYEAGYPVPMRHNHTLFIASYPMGRDAAVSYDEMNLVWKNDSSSDVLLCTSHTDSTVTVTLYGVSQEYSVESETGDWVEGEDYDTRIFVDPLLDPSAEYTSEYGEKGGSVSVHRIVTDANGKIVREDDFHSLYDSSPEVKVMGESDEAKELLAKGKASYITEEQRQSL